VPYRGVTPTRADVAEHVAVDKGVVVGDDGSTPAARAMLWAAEDALRRMAPLHVVRAWTGATIGRLPDWSETFVPTREEMQESARAALERHVERVLGTPIGLDLRVQVVHGPAAQVLIEASHAADALVIGASGQRHRGEAALGTTAEACLRHATCPVVVLR
jgi:nucleotide-binding universal stress UspA family protein